MRRAEDASDLAVGSLAAEAPPLSQAGLPVGPVRPAGVPAKGSRPFTAVAADGRGLFI